MIVEKRKVIYWLIGAVILFPLLSALSFRQFPYLQIFIISTFLFFYILRHKKHSLTLLDQIVFAYLSWIFISFSLNAFFNLDPRENIHRFISFFVCVGCMSPYLISRNYFKNPSYLKYIFWGVVGTYSIFFLYTILQFLTFGIEDLFAAREILGQGLPMIICFVATIALYYALNCSRNKQAKFFLYFFCLIGIILILLSLTRAVYLQLIIGIFFIAFIVLRSKRKSLIKKTLFEIVALFVIVFLINSLGLFSYETIAARFSDLLGFDLLERDVSAIDRITMWTALLNELKQQPLRIILGYGQLGPSYVGPKMISPVSGRDIQFYSAHNEHLDVLIRNGVVGLILYLVIWVLVICGGFFPKREMPHDARTLFVGHSIALLGVLGYGLFHETVRYPIFGMYFWFYLGIVSAVLYSKKEPLLGKNNSKEDETCKT